MAIFLLSTVCLLPAQAPLRTAGFDPIRAAEDEALRRAETRIVMELILKRAEGHRKAKRFAAATLLYEETIRLAGQVGNVKAIAKDVAKAREGIVDSGLRLARALQDQDFFEEADGTAARALVHDPDNRRLLRFRQSNEKVRKAHIGRVPSREVRTAIQGHRHRQAQVLTLVRDGKAYYDMGRWAEAEKRLQEAVKLDPQSDVAYYYLRLILEAKHDLEGRARDHHFQRRIIEIAEAWNR